MRRFGGVWLLVMMSEMKFAVIPIIAIRQMACRILTYLKVAPRAP